MQPAVSNEVGAYKALILIHKMLMGGCPVTLIESYRERNFFDTFMRYYGSYSTYGYSTLIQSYVLFLKAKLEFHNIFKEFTGNFDFESYSVSKSINDVNEGYQIICELMNLQEKLENFYRLVFTTIKPSSISECRVSSLVPIVEESFGMYNFMTSFLLHLFQKCEFVDPLFPLQERYTKQFYTLKKFYDDCSRISYLTSLITIPKLPDKPPVMFEDMKRKRENEKAESTIVPVKKPDPPKPTIEFPQEKNSNLLDFGDEYSDVLSVTQNSQVDRLYEDLQKELQNYKIQFQRDQMMISQYNTRLNDMDRHIQMLNQKIATTPSVDGSQIRMLQEQINQWKSKYEAILEMYNNLKNEHYELLNKYKTEITSNMSANTEQINKLKEEINRLIAEKRQNVLDFEKFKEKSQMELTRLRKELIDSSTNKVDLTKSVERENSLKQRIERLLLENNDLQNSLRDLENRNSEIDSDTISELNEKMKSLIKEKNLLAKNVSELKTKIANSLEEHEEKDKLLEDYQVKIIENDSVFKKLLILAYSSRVYQSYEDYNNQSISGNRSSNRNIVLSYAEDLSVLLQTLSSKTLNINESELDDFNTEKLDSVCRIFNHFVYSLKGAIENENIDENLYNDELSSLNDRVYHASQFIAGLFAGTEELSSVLEFIRDLQDCISEFCSNLSENLIENRDDSIENMTEFVSNEIASISKLISDSLKQLNDLKYDVSIDFHADTSGSLSQIVLEGAIAITNAIDYLIKCAIIVQEEIVAEGKGTGSVDSFYKRHHRWTEGLVSAAKTVGFATKFLVEVSDQCVKGKRQINEVIVAAREVAASTAQLVAAAKVKSSRESKSQWDLEEAAKSVTDASRLLVKAVEEISEAESSIAKMSLTGMSSQQLKVEEMNQQIKILSLEKELADSRKLLAHMRRENYQDAI